MLGHLHKLCNHSCSNRANTDIRGYWKELSYPGFEGVLDGHELHGDHRQDLDVNTIELIEAGPRARTKRRYRAKRNIKNHGN